MPSESVYLTLIKALATSPTYLVLLVLALAGIGVVGMLLRELARNGQIMSAVAASIRAKPEALETLTKGLVELNAAVKDLVDESIRTRTFRANLDRKIEEIDCHQRQQDSRMDSLESMSERASLRLEQFGEVLYQNEMRRALGEK